MPEHVFDRAQLHYARGEALARRGDAAAVRAEAAAIAALRTSRDSPALGQRGGQLVEVFQYVLEGRAAMLADDAAAAQTAYRKAMETQIAADFGMDPPLFWYSVRRSLAAATLAAGDAQSARAQIYASLRRWPNDRRCWGDDIRGGRRRPPPFSREPRASARDEDRARPRLAAKQGDV